MKPDTPLWATHMLGSTQAPCEKCEALRESRNYFRRARTAMRKERNNLQKENDKLRAMIDELTKQLKGE